MQMSKAVSGLSAGPWWVSEDLHHSVSDFVRAALERFHREHPLLAGADLSVARSAAVTALERAGGPAGAGPVDAVLDHLAESGTLVRTGSEVRLASHRVALEDRKEEVERLVEVVVQREPTPPSIAELQSEGFSREMVEAAARAGVAPSVWSVIESGQRRLTLDDAWRVCEALGMDIRDLLHGAPDGATRALGL